MSPRRTLVAVALVAAMISPAAAIGSTAQQPAPMALTEPSETIVSQAKEWFHRFQAGDIDRSQLDARMNSELTQRMITDESGKLKPLGDPASFTFLRTHPVVDSMGYDFMLDFGNERILETLAYDAEGKIAGIAFMMFVRR